MKTMKGQKVQEARAAQAARSEASIASPVDDFRAYAPAGAAIAPSASQAAEPQPGSSRYFNEDDMEMNRRIHGGSSTESEEDYEDGVESYPEEDLDSDGEDSEEEFAESDDEGHAEASESGDGVAVSVKEIVRNINRIAFGYVERGKMEIGQYVLQVVFKDNIDDVLSKNPNKTESLRKICDDPELRVDRRRLGNWVRAAALHRDLEANDVDCTGIMASQLVALLRVKDKDKRRELAQEVNSEGLSLRQILQRADELNNNGNSKSAAKSLRRKINDPLSLLADKEAIALLEDQDRLAEEIPYKDRIEMVTVIDEVADRMEMSKDFLEKVRDNLVLIDMQRLQRSTA
ncbi:MAG: hypothetical protein ACLP5H_30790 [Desulfomonilaceae bacterium]